MKTTIAKFRAGLSRFIEKAQEGHEIELQKHSTVVARLTSVKRAKKHTTRLGAGAKNTKILDDLAKPLIKNIDWKMHSKSKKVL